MGTRLWPVLFASGRVNRNPKMKIAIRAVNCGFHESRASMLVILTSPDEIETWMTAPADEALKLQRPLPDGSLRIVARSVKEDPAPAT